VHRRVHLGVVLGGGRRSDRLRSGRGLDLRMRREEGEQGLRRSGRGECGGRDQRRERSGGEELVWHGTPRRTVTIVRRGNGQKGSMFLVTKPSNARNRPEPLGICCVLRGFLGHWKEVLRSPSLPGLTRQS